LVSIGVGIPYVTECHCIVRNGNRWKVYYSEPGPKGALATFDDEDAAGRHLSALLQMDSRVNLKS
jgi:hypothetical protein